MNLYPAKITMGGEPVDDANVADEIVEILVNPNTIVEAEDPDVGGYLVELGDERERGFLKKGFLEISDDVRGEHAIITFERD